MQVDPKDLLDKLAELNMVLVPFVKKGKVVWLASRTAKADIPGVRGGHVIDAEGEVLHETVEEAILYAMEHKHA